MSTNRNFINNVYTPLIILRMTKIENLYQLAWNCIITMSNLTNLSKYLAIISEIQSLITNDLSQFAKDYDMLTTYYYDQESESFNLTNKEDSFCLPMMFFLAKWKIKLHDAYPNVFDCDSEDLTHDHFFPNTFQPEYCKTDRICITCKENDQWGCMAASKNNTWEWVCDCCYEGIDKI
jgi:hypothetical protein